MKKVNIALLLLMFAFSLPAQLSAQPASRSVAVESIPGDNTMRCYRLAIPVAYSSFDEDLDGNYNNVLKFWQECEDFTNSVFVPLGICFDVVEDERLVMQSPNLIDESIYNAPSYGTELANEAIGSASYDVGLWVVHRPEYAENSGLSIDGGAYSLNTRCSGYAKTDKWVVAHELGHMFGAPHTTTGEGSLMDAGGEFFSYPSIKKIREAMVQHGAGGAYRSYAVTNSAPVFDESMMQEMYRIPQGACMAIPVYATDAEGHTLTYAAMGCSSSTVDNVTEGGNDVHFASLQPSVANTIDYRPRFSADIYDNRYFYLQSGTDIPSMEPGVYSIAFVVNDVPHEMNYEALSASPFYGNYAVWDADVQVVGGSPFTASLSPAKDSYTAGEHVEVQWGVNSNYFTADSRVRITMSANYGLSFDYVLAESVPARDGSCVVELPGVNVGNVDVDFVTAVRSMPGGIIRVEEIGGVAYTLTALSPEQGGCFNVTGGTETGIEKVKTENGNVKTENGTEGRRAEVIKSNVKTIYDLQGRSVDAPVKGVYIIDGKKQMLR